MIKVGDKYKFEYTNPKTKFSQIGESEWKNDMIDFRRAREGRAYYLSGSPIYLVDEEYDAVDEFNIEEGNVTDG